MISVIDAISAISNEKGISLFNAIALSESYDSSILIAKLNLTRKQFYSNLKKLIDVGLIKRNSGKYSLTLFGKVVFNAYAKIETGVKEYWKLKALESILGSRDNGDLSAQECQMIIDRLIDNAEIKDTLVQIAVQTNL